MQVKSKAFNSQIFLEILCYLSFAGIMFYLVSTEKYLSYVTPRMKPYLYFTATVMFIWAFMGIFRLFQPQHKIRSAHCFVLVIPILFLLLPHGQLKTSDLSGNYVGGNALSGLSGQNVSGVINKQTSSDNSGFGTSSSNSTEVPVKDSTTSADAPSSVDITYPVDNTSNSLDTTVSDAQTKTQEDEYSINLSGLDVKNKVITVSNDDFGVWISEIYSNAKNYEGYTIMMTGTVFKDTEMLEGDEFVPGRLMMSCCVADLSLVGIRCKYEKASELKADSWVTVEGTIHIGKYEYDGVEYDEPQVFVTKITPADEVEGYVYPY
nr:TIGR03943 family protein [Sedimentibacter sp.]